MKKDEAFAAKKAMLGQELDRRLADTGRRLDSSLTRASIVIATSVVIVLIPATRSGWWWTSFVFFTIAGLVAFGTLFYRDGDEVPIVGLRMVIDDHTPETLSDEIFDKKLKMLGSEEASMTRRAGWLTASYFLFLVGAVFTILAHLL